MNSMESGVCCVFVQHYQGCSDFDWTPGYLEQCAHHNYFGKAFYFCSCAHDLQGALAKTSRDMCVHAQLVLGFGM